MGKREARIEDYLRDRVVERGGVVRKVVWQGRRGAADRLIWFTFPNVALVECKAEGEDVDWRSPQGREIVRMRAAGWPVHVVSSRAAVDALVEGMADGN